jgi:hypothetical protein
MQSYGKGRKTQTALFEREADITYLRHLQQWQKIFAQFPLFHQISG